MFQITPCLKTALVTTETLLEGVPWNSQVNSNLPRLTIHPSLAIRRTMYSKIGAHIVYDHYFSAQVRSICNFAQSTLYAPISVRHIFFCVLWGVHGYSNIHLVRLFSHSRQPFPPYRLPRLVLNCFLCVNFIGEVYPNCRILVSSVMFRLNVTYTSHKDDLFSWQCPSAGVFILRQNHNCQGYRLRDTYHISH